MGRHRTARAAPLKGLADVAATLTAPARRWEHKLPMVHHGGAGSRYHCVHLQRTARSTERVLHRLRLTDEVPS